MIACSICAFESAVQLSVGSTPIAQSITGFHIVFLSTALADLKAGNIVSVGFDAGGKEIWVAIDLDAANELGAPAGLSV